MPKLSLVERDAFLSETPGFIMDIATLDAEGAPHLCPIWFLLEEGRIWFTPRQHSEWLARQLATLHERLQGERQDDPTTT